MAIIVLASLMVASAVVAAFLAIGAEPAAVLGMGGAAFLSSVTCGISVRRFMED